MLRKPKGWSRRKHAVALVVTALLSILLMLQSATVMQGGQVTYKNYRNLTVVAPFAVLIGVLGFVLVAIATWRSRRGRGS